MQYDQEDYTKFYIVQALFKLMKEYNYNKISVTDIVKKAGVGRATFYRYFKSKEDVILHYFRHHTQDFVAAHRFYPRCRADYIDLVKDVLKYFEAQKERFMLIRQAHLEYIYLDYLNKMFVEKFIVDHDDLDGKLLPYIYAGMLFNVSMKWLDDGCKRPIGELADMIVDAVYFEK